MAQQIFHFFVIVAQDNLQLLSVFQEMCWWRIPFPSANPEKISVRTYQGDSDLQLAAMVAALGFPAVLPKMEDHGGSQTVSQVVADSRWSYHQYATPG
jgi:hypothetical protein